MARPINSSFTDNNYSSYIKKGIDNMSYKKYPFYFKVLILVEDKQVYNCGMGVASGYSDAASFIEKYYGDELLQIEHLELFEESNLIFLPEGVCENYRNCEFPQIEYQKEKKKGE